VATAPTVPRASRARASALPVPRLVERCATFQFFFYSYRV